LGEILDLSLSLFKKKKKPKNTDRNETLRFFGNVVSKEIAKKWARFNLSPTLITQEFEKQDQAEFLSWLRKKGNVQTRTAEKVLVFLNKKNPRHDLRKQSKEESSTSLQKVSWMPYGCRRKDSYCK